MMAGIRLNHNGQKRLIMDCLHGSPMTVESLARRLLCSPDTVRKRLRELQEETGTVRVVGWDMKGTSLVRVWGVGVKRRGMPVVPPPSCGQKREMQQGRAACALEKAASRGKGGERPVPYRLEAMDRWIFAIRRAS